MNENKIFIEQLISKMTLKEKIGQMYQTICPSSIITGNSISLDTKEIIEKLKKGEIGSFLGLYDNKVIKELQRIAIEESRLKIPLMFCNDIIHGCRTIFPINLALSCTFNPKLIEESCRKIAYEASHSGVHLTFSPMLDLVRDPRWGRVMESNGEDPYLSKVLAKAYVKGYQGKSLNDENSIASCAKHFVGYGACIAGRDYNSVDMSIDSLYNCYLPPFKEAIKKAPMIMSSFNTFNGIPVTCNEYLLKNVLRDNLKFNGVIISDYESTTELLKHKVCIDAKEVALKTIHSTLDIEMVGTNYINNLENLVSNQLVKEELINNAVKRILELKLELGLFQNPYKNIYLDFEKYWLYDSTLKKALEAASESICLLENDGVLPINKKQKCGFIGKFVDEKRVIGVWSGKANLDDTITLKQVLLKNKFLINNIDNEFNEDIIKKNDIIFLTAGEDQSFSGEAASRSNIILPEEDDYLIDKVIDYNINNNLNKKIILIIYAGRPLILTKYKKYYQEKKISAILYTWFLGTMSGEAIYNTLYGINNPSGKLTMCFPNSIGQIPIYYNSLPTGRPIDLKDDYRSKYLDVDSKPLYQFGYGLSYSTFNYGKININKKIIKNKKDVINIDIDITNISKKIGKEVIFLYIEAKNNPVSRPNYELKRFKKIELKGNETKNVKFTLTYNDFGYYMYKNQYKLDKLLWSVYNGVYLVKIPIDNNGNCEIAEVILDLER